MYAVKWTSRAFNSDCYVHGSTLENTQVATREDAMILAEVCASEHADRAQVTYEPGVDSAGEKTGFYLRTKMGCDVWYTVVHHTERANNEKLPR